MAISRKYSDLIRYVILVFFAVIFLIPLFLTLSNSINPSFSAPTFFPVSFHWGNYGLATTMIDFWKFTKNSFILCFITVSTTTFSSGLVGYAFARFQAPGKKHLFMIVVATMMLPGIVTQIPTYILFYNLGILNSYMPWLLWGLGGSAFFIFLFRQFFSSIPKELEEAARIDGCSIFRTYWNIFLPLSAPAIATVIILVFQHSWGDFMGPFMFLKTAKYPLATALGTMRYAAENNDEVINQQVTAAASILFMIPVLLAFFIGQRYLIEGIVTTGIKG